MRWLELRIEVDGEAVEAVGEVFSRVAPGGVAIEESVEIGRDEDFIRQPNLPVTVRAYLPLDGAQVEKTADVEQALWYLNAIWPIGKLEMKEVADEDWANAWKEFYHPVRIGRRFLVRPLWREVAPDSARVQLNLDPGMAFGTGLHPTTQLCLEALDSDIDRHLESGGALNTVLAGRDVLDLGTGSGILGIAAAKLGAKSLLALDIDSVAVDAALGNFVSNDISLSEASTPDNIHLGQGSLPLDKYGYSQPGGKTRDFDLIFANIIARVIIDLAPDLERSLRPDGLLIASGIIKERREEVESALVARGLSVEARPRGDWFALICKKARPK